MPIKATVPYTGEMLLDTDDKPDIHYVLGGNSTDEAAERLERNDFPTRINRCCDKLEQCFHGDG